MNLITVTPFHHLSDFRFGRKPTVIGFGILSSMFGMFLPYSTYYPMFLMVRFLGAVCNEAADLAAYVLCMEVTGKIFLSNILLLLLILLFPNESCNRFCG